MNFEFGRFLAPCFPELSVVDMERAPWFQKQNRLNDADSSVGANEQANKQKRLLDLVAWSAAWDRYTLVAVMLGQLEFSQAVRHKAAVYEVWRPLTFLVRLIGWVVCYWKVACIAASQQKRPFLAVIYDEVIR